MMTEKMMIRSLGNEPPLLADGRRAPDRREVSLRWLSGTFLTGITSSVLMGVALFAALDGRQQLAIPAEAYASANADALADTGVTRGDRLIAPAIAAKPSDRAIMEVSTVVHDGDKEVVRRQPFSHVKMRLAANHVTTEDYPDFDALAIFSADEGQPAPAARTGAIYGSDVESEVSLKTIAFPTGKSEFQTLPGMTLDEIEENVRSNGSALTDGTTQVSALYYVDPQRFSNEDNDIDLTSGLSARVLEQNMTVSAPESITPETEEFADDIIPARQDVTIAKALIDSGYPEPQAKMLAANLSALFGSEELSKGDVLRIGIIQKGEQARLIRASVYRGTRHLVTIALDDKNRFVQASEPPMLDAVATAFDDNSQSVPAGQNLPSVYDGIYRASLSYGMTKEMTALIIKLLAANVDFQAQLRPTDFLEAFFSVADSSGRATADSELLYVNARFGDTVTRFYRFQDPDGNVDYFDQDGKSIRQFLLRNPVPNGIFKSGFGMRRHPILGFARMHTGVDWAAPRGTAIIATGNGTVEKAGWDSGGYGNQTIVRHANGYESSYNHQSAIAKGIVPGAKVRQGQVIGWVGTTGESTGPHLHYELIVNGTKVDPLRIRLPGGKSLDGDALAKFEDERKRIDTLLNNQPVDQVASK
ncbi:M23 family metallopeptidase [Rhizobium sp. P32RR-XVIII]|uniref:M23 family metallopeptidase n=1 Tax=Rhizobium sp. P32RR-XVIII TaxID=2726738 RepID=UPI0014576FC1|nr:M23 family metallopeptidase [Rhizobium sp. P32RR-XVIII]NLS06565.1 M23 family metallopeptidase [Rhizobium sp. P32RR-XVIII]